MKGSYLDHVKDEPVEAGRYLTLRQTLAPFRPLFSNRVVLDFGAGYGLSACGLVELGASRVIGVEPNRERVQKSTQILRDLEMTGEAVILPVPYSAQLPFADSSFEVVLANAVFEHIPAPRLPYMRELWRLLSPGGYLIINESPNKYLPIDFHTTEGLLFVPWMPGRIARRYAIWRGRFRADADWYSSGWRGIGYYEIVQGLTRPYRVLPERTKLRHRVLSLLGLPASLLDPYPTLIFQKGAGK